MISILGISGEGRERLSTLFSSGRRLVSTQETAELLHVDAVTAAQLLARWSRQGWVRRVRRGLYIPVPVDVGNPQTWSEDALVLADAVWAPCSFSGWTSANHWGLTEQVFQTVVVKAGMRVRHSDERLLEHRYLVTHVDPDDLEWGMSVVWRGERRLRMADPARTVVDVLDDPRLGGGIRHAAEIVSAYLREHEPERLVAYGDRLGNRTVFKRLGYIVEATGQDHPGLIEACTTRVSAGYSLLDPSAPASGRRVARWGVRANVKVAPDGPS